MFEMGLVFNAYVLFGQTRNYLNVDVPVLSVKVNLLW